MATWATSPAATPGRWRRPGSSVPAARAAWNGSLPVTSAHAVDGAPLSAAARTTAPTFIRRR
jgi:hypothetical protein